MMTTWAHTKVYECDNCNQYQTITRNTKQDHRETEVVCPNCKETASSKGEL